MQFTTVPTLQSLCELLVSTSAISLIGCFKKISVGDQPVMTAIVSLWQHNIHMQYVSERSVKKPHLQMVRLQSALSVSKEKLIKFLSLLPAQMTQFTISECAFFVDRHLLRLFISCPELRDLTCMSCNTITTEGFEEALQKEIFPKHLLKLHLRNCTAITNEIVKKIIQRCLNITYLDIAQCPLITPEVFTCLENTSLETLYISHIPSQEIIFPKLRHLFITQATCPQLSNFPFKGVENTLHTLHIQSSSPAQRIPGTFTQLRTVHLQFRRHLYPENYSNCFGPNLENLILIDPIIKSFTFLSACKHLKHLELRNGISNNSQSMTNETFLTLSDAIRKTLSVLRINSGNFSDIGYFEQLQELDVNSCNHITFEGIKNACTSRLKKLCIRAANIVTLRELSCTQLTELHLGPIFSDIENLPVMIRKSLKILSIHSNETIKQLGCFLQLEQLQLTGTTLPAFEHACGTALHTLHIQVYGDQLHIDGEKISSHQLKHLTIESAAEKQTTLTGNFLALLINNQDTLTSLTIRKCTLPISTNAISMKLKSLHTLILQEMVLADSLMKVIAHTCSALETLVMENCVLDIDYEIPRCLQSCIKHLTLTFLDPVSFTESFSVIGCFADSLETVKITWDASFNKRSDLFSRVYDLTIYANSNTSYTEQDYLNILRIFPYLKILRITPRDHLLVETLCNQRIQIKSYN